MLAILRRKPLEYRVKGKRGGGSHKRLISAAGYPDIPWWAHDKDELKPSVVRSILVDGVGLTEAEARKLV